MITAARADRHRSLRVKRNRRSHRLPLNRRLLRRKTRNRKSNAVVDWIVTPCKTTTGSFASYRAEEREMRMFPAEAEAGEGISFHMFPRLNRAAAFVMV